MPAKDLGVYADGSISEGFVCVYLQYLLFGIVDNVIPLMTVVIAVGERGMACLLLSL